MVTLAADEIRIGRVEHHVTVLGPGERSVVWVAGCSLACQGCITPELWDPRAGRTVAQRRLASELAEHAVDGVTWSGGEPFEQAAAVAGVCLELRRQRPDLSLMSYSGYPRRVLERRTDPGVVALLGLLDLLVDAPYVERHHAPLRWRGSRNQTIHDLSGRHAADLDAPDEPAGLHRHVDEHGAVRFTGVPPVAGFRPAFEAALTQRAAGSTEGRT